MSIEGNDTTQNYSEATKPLKGSKKITDLLIPFLAERAENKRRNWMLAKNTRTITCILLSRTPSGPLASGKLPKNY